jgi:hypothetical protein
MIEALLYFWRLGGWYRLGPILVVLGAVWAFVLMPACLFGVICGPNSAGLAC